MNREGERIRRKQISKRCLGRDGEGRRGSVGGGREEIGRAKQGERGNGEKEVNDLNGILPKIDGSNNCIR